MRFVCFVDAPVFASGAAMADGMLLDTGQEGAAVADVVLLVFR